MEFMQGWHRALRALAIALTALIGLAAAAPSWATHENDHRYTIWGEVRTSAGAPVADADVRITGLGGRPLAETRSGADGRYRVLLHVHNSGLGMPFWVTVGRSAVKGTVTFNPNDKNTVREHRVDIEVPG